MDESAMTLLRDWNGNTDLTGWLASEKFDGCRAFWDGFNLWTRSGRKIKAPRSFKAQLPQGFRLDGEIWAGRERLTEATTAVNHGKFTARIRYMVFDAPDVAGAWDVRLAAAAGRVGGGVAEVAKFWRVKDFADLQIRFFKIWGNGGEGLVLRHPGVTAYERGRTKNALRIKRDPYWGY